MSIANRGNLRRIALSALDPNRAQIDRVVTQMLGLPANAATLTEWRRLVCLQSIVNGNTQAVLQELRRAGITP